jgi:hypothetical protein
MTKSALFNFVFGSVLGLALGLALATFISHPAVADAQLTVDDQAKTIEVQKETIAKQQESLDLREKAIVTMSNEMQAAMTNPGAQLLARTGHIMDETQCRAWDSATNPTAATFSTVPVSQ